MVFKTQAMKPKGRAIHGKQKRETAMAALLEARQAKNCSNPVDEVSQEALNELVVAMGKRLQAEYLDGAIPYLRQHEPEFWAQLEALDQDETLETLLAYEGLFFEGLRRYVSHLEALRQAA